MRQTRTKKVKTTQVITTNILCNKCGKSCCNEMRTTKTPKIENYHGLIEVEVHGGYDSEAIGDMTSWRFSLCEHCILKLSKTFKIPMEIKDDVTRGEYVTPEVHNKLTIQAHKDNHKEWVKALREKDPTLKAKDLKGKTSHELYDLYHSYPRSSK